MGPGSAAGTDWIQCDECNGWIDYSLSGLPLPYVERNVKKMKFACKPCNLERRIEMMTGEISSLKTRIAALEAGSATDKKLYSDMFKVPDELEEVKKSISALASTTTAGPSAPLTAPQLRQASDEAADVKKRELNLIISGLAEGNNDLEAITQYAGLCKVHLAKEDVEGADRLRRPGPKPRLLRLKVKSAQKRKALLAMRLVDRPPNSLPQVYIRPDLTKAQQEVDKLLRDELAVVGKDRFMIRRGKIVPRPAAENKAEGSGRDNRGSGEGVEGGEGMTGQDGGVGGGDGGIESQVRKTSANWGGRR